MGRKRMIVEQCWSCDHVNAGVRVRRARSAFTCEACGRVNDSFFTISSVKCVHYDEPTIWNNFERVRWVHWTPITDRNFDAFAVAWSDWGWGE